MRNIWVRIGLGAAAVFAAGMLVVSVAGQVRSAATEAVQSAVAGVGRAIASAPARADLPFLLAGTRIGSIRRLNINRAAQGDLPDVHLTVDLSPEASTAELARCFLVPEQEPALDPEKGFRCEGQGVGGRVTIGQARFEPGGLERPIRVTRSMERELRQGDPFEATADVGGQVRVLARGDSGALVNLKADSTGLSLNVQDGLERAVLHMMADSTGASLRIRGDHGQVVRLEASQAGVFIRVDSAAKP